MAPLHRAAASQIINNNSDHHLQLIQHFTHLHPLQNLHIPLQFNCDACNTTGHGARFRCTPCDFDLHYHCATAPATIASHHHLHHHLTLVNRPGKSHFCNVCGATAHGLLYTCHACDFDVHPPCSHLTAVPSPPSAASGGYNYQANRQGIYAVNNNNGSSTLAKVGKMAANVLVTSIIGVPLNNLNFSSRK